MCNNVCRCVPTTSCVVCEYLKKKSVTQNFKYCVLCVCSFFCYSFCTGTGTCFCSFLILIHFLFLGMDLSLADVSFIHAKLGSEKDSIKRRNGATPSAVSSKSSASAKQKEKSKNSNKSKNGASSNKRNKKKSKKEIEEEAAGYLIHQRKILLTNYMTCCKKLKVDPDAQLVYQMEVHL